MRLNLNATKTVAAPLLAPFVALGTPAVAQAAPTFMGERIVVTATPATLVSSGTRTGRNPSDPTNLGF